MTQAKVNLSGWQPEPRLVGRRAGDKALFERLYAATATAVAPFLLKRFQAFSAQEVAHTFLSQARALQQFLLEEVRPKQELGADLRALQLGLGQALSAQLNPVEARAADEALAQDMAMEFARGAWATVMSQLYREFGHDAQVQPQRLLSDDLLHGQTPLMALLEQDLGRFDLSATELNIVMFKTLEALRESEVRGDWLVLPLVSAPK